MLILRLMLALLGYRVRTLADIPTGSVEELFQFQDSTEQIVKRHMNGKSRLIFVAGLEGTGHHAWSDMFKECVMLEKCEVEYNLTQTLMHFDHTKHVLHGLFGAIDAPFNAIQIQKVMENMQALSQRYGDHIYLIGLTFVRLSAMMSYPNYNGLNKPLDHPDISVLAMIAEWAGIDFRVIVLQREAEDILKSTARRGIGGREEPKILISNAAVLHSQMLLLDRRFYQCIQYKELGKLSQQSKEKLVDFLHPTLLGPIMDRLLSKVVYTGTNTTRPYDRNMVRMDRRASSGARSGENVSHTDVSSEVHRVSSTYHAWQLAQHLHQIDTLCRR